MEYYIPDIYKLNIFEIDYDKLKECGIKCLLFDLDNTLVLRYAKHIDEELKDLIERLSLDFKVIIYSNGIKLRVSIFTNLLEIDGIYSARKPGIFNYIKLMKKYKFDQNEVCMIGDQMMTDIKGGNKAGITTVLVDPLSKKEDIWTKVNRLREKIVVNKLNKRDLFFKGRYYDK